MFTNKKYLYTTASNNYYREYELKEQLLNTLPLCTTIVFVGRRSLKNEA